MKQNLIRDPEAQHGTSKYIQNPGMYRDAGKSGQDVDINVYKQTYSIVIRLFNGHSITWTGPASPDSLVEKQTGFGDPIRTIAYESGPTGFGLARAAQRRLGHHQIYYQTLSV